MLPIKKIQRSLLYLLLLVSAAGWMSSCSKDDSETGTPVISYIRITRPESSDSLLVGAGQGQLIAIVGANLYYAYQYSGSRTHANSFGNP